MLRESDGALLPSKGQIIESPGNLLGNSTRGNSYATDLRLEREQSSVRLPQHQPAIESPGKEYRLRKSPESTSVLIYHAGFVVPSIVALSCSRHLLNCEDEVFVHSW